MMYTKYMHPLNRLSQKECISMDTTLCCPSTEQTPGIITLSALTESNQMLIIRRHQGEGGQPLLL